MKRVIRFSRYRFIMIGLSTAVIITGAILLAVRGLNMGIDFRGGLTQQIQIAPVALTLSASGDAKVEASSYSGERQLLGGAAIGFTVTKGAESQSFRFPFADYPTVRELAAVCETVPGVTAKVAADPALASSRLFPVDLPVEISQHPLAINYSLEPGAKPSATIQTVRSALGALGQFEVQTLGKPEEQQFILKLGIPEGDSLEARQALEVQVKGLLGTAFSADEVIVRKTDFVGPSLAGELATQTISVVAVALVLMLLYLSLRFRFEFALATVLCVVHDSAVMMTVALALGLEFSTSIIAAILTIIGYSVNDTIVIFDRVRENSSLMRDAEETMIFDTSLTQTLGRTIITSFVTPSLRWWRCTCSPRAPSRTSRSCSSWASWWGPTPRSTSRLPWSWRGTLQASFVSAGGMQPSTARPQERQSRPGGAAKRLRNRVSPACSLGLLRAARWSRRAPPRERPRAAFRPRRRGAPWFGSSRAGGRRRNGRNLVPAEVIPRLRLSRDEGAGRPAR
jgi:preprotein translocase subunit SecF